jgi:hypothetical protein
VVRALGVGLWLLGGCSSGISPKVADPSALLSWCGPELCGWTIEAGSIDRVSTWHELEYGAGLRGDLTVLSTEWAPSTGDARCLEAALTARRVTGPELEVELEPLDGEPDPQIWYVSLADYEIREHRFEFAASAGAYRIRVTKRGGEAVLAYLSLGELLPAIAECEP